MTKSAAKLLLEKGVKITHTYFFQDEFIEQVDGYLKDAEGMIYNESDFCKLWFQPIYEDGWDIYLDTK